jgi:HSP20 family molecular chaperone IbpA
MYSDFLPTITTCDLLSLFTPIKANSLTEGFEKINGVSLKTTLENPTSESQSDHKLKFKLPGYEKNEIKISIENFDKSRRYRVIEAAGFLKVTIVAQNKEEGTTRYEGYFPQSVDDSTIQAKLNNGILTLTAKTDPKKTREREIQIS